MNWVHNGKEIRSHDDFTNDVIGFIYCITYTNGQQYIGKKLVRSYVRVAPTKAQLAIRKNYKRMEWKNKPFANYNGSSKNTSGLTITKKEIIELCSSKIDLTYCETKWLFRFDVLFNDIFLNDNIGGKFFDGKISKGL